jgi:hypothetical protein
MMNKKILWSLLIVGALLTGATVGFIQSQTIEQHNAEILKTMVNSPELLTDFQITIQVDRGEGANSIKELAGNSDLIIRGQVISLETLKEEKPEGRIPTIWTIYTFKISEILKGKTESDTIKIFQYGGVWKGITASLVDEPGLVINEDSILFLHQMEPDLYRIYAGPWGRYVVEEGGVYNIAEVSSKASGVPSTLFTGGTSFTNFKNSLP